MFLEGPGRRKLAQFVPDHVFRHKYGIENLAVVHQKRVSNEIRRDHGASGPGLNWFLGSAGTHLLDLFEKLYFHERSLFQRSAHRLFRLFLVFSPFNDEGIARFMFATCFKSFSQLSPGTDRMMASATPFTLALTTAHRMIDGIH